MPKKAERRMQDRLAKQRTMRMLLRLYDTSPESITPRLLGKHSRTPRLCSCPLCRNPRKALGLATRQEVLAGLRARESSGA